MYDIARENNEKTFIRNVTNEIMFVGAIYKKPDLFVEYGHNIRSKYDFIDEGTKFFYDLAEVIYKTRSQEFNRSVVTTFVSEDTERMSLYKKYGGWNTLESWIKLAEIKNFKNYFEVLKKYSLLREYQRNGFNIDKIVSHPKFEELSAKDIYRLIRGKADKIHTVILSNEEGEILNNNIKRTLLKCMETPDLGLKLPFPIMNDIFRGAKKRSCMAIGMLSNAGKTRLMTKILAYFALVLNERVLVLLNEMTIEELRYALITTVINNPEFQELHGLRLNKIEKEITLGLYKDKEGDFIYPLKDKDGNTIESIEEYADRVASNSYEFVQIMKIADWIEDSLKGLIFAKDISTAYDDKTLEFEIRKAKLTLGVNYVFYDTAKSDISAIGDWAAFKATVTKLTELFKELDMFGYLSIQLADDANFINPDELTSSNISNAKQIKHVLHTLILFKEIPKKMYHKYYYKKADDPDWGERGKHDLDLNKKYYCGNVDKNRFGKKLKLLFEVDLDRNIWIEVGELERK